MKTRLSIYSVILLYLFFVVACSTKKNTLLNRTYHGVTTKYNVLYNGNIALEKGINELKEQYRDNFWEILPIERMQIKETVTFENEDAVPKSTHFEKSEEKAIKAIQKHSMNIDGEEKNPQADKAYMLLGKTRYYDQRFVPALEAFNYILYKHPGSRNIYEARIWREKTNLRLGNEEFAIRNLKRLLLDMSFQDQTVADAYAILAQGYLNIEAKDSAIIILKKALKLTQYKEEKARYRFILGQLYDANENTDSAKIFFKSVIKMKRKSPKRYTINAEAKLADYFIPEKDDKVDFLKKYEKLLNDRENRPYLDLLNYHLGLFYEKIGDQENAIKYYNISLKTKSNDNHLWASNYRNLAEINFNNSNYIVAGQYYDSTMTKMNPKSREYRKIQKKRENLEDVIKYEGIIKRNDSIIYVAMLSEKDQKSYYEHKIIELKEANEKKEALNKKISDAHKSLSSISIAPATQNTGTFYFYNSTTLAYGKNEFKRKWGNRILNGNWRLSSDTKNITNKGDLNPDENIIENDTVSKNKEKIDDTKYSLDYYLKAIPKDKKVLDSIIKERDLSYYQLGLVYKDKFNEYQLAENRLEKLLSFLPEERLILPSMYNLYKVYDLTDKIKAEVMKRRIINEYPNSHYAQILNNTKEDITNLITGDPEKIYNTLYKSYKLGQYKNVLSKIDTLVEQYSSAEEIVPKLELLKAHIIGKLKGLTEYKKALNFVSLNYPNSKEGKQAEQLLANNIPILEKLDFDQESPTGWKIIFEVEEDNEEKIKIIHDKIDHFIKDRAKYDILKKTTDHYTMNDNFIVIHGFYSEQKARDALEILSEFRDYKIPYPAYIISSDNYKVVQINKNFEEYIKNKKP